MEEGHVGGCILNVLYTVLLTTYGGKTDGGRRTLTCRHSSLVVIVDSGSSRLGRVVNAIDRVRSKFHHVGRTRKHVAIGSTGVRSRSAGRLVHRGVRCVRRIVTRGHSVVTRLGRGLHGDTTGSSGLGRIITSFAARLRRQTREVRMLRTRLTRGSVLVTHRKSAVDGLGTGIGLLARRGGDGARIVVRRSELLRAT